MGHTTMLVLVTSPLANSLVDVSRVKRWHVGERTDFAMGDFASVVVWKLKGLPIEPSSLPPLVDLVPLSIDIEL